MIDVYLLIYAGTLAIFIVGVMVMGVLCVIVFTVTASLVGLARARKNGCTRSGESEAWDLENDLPAGVSTVVPRQINTPAGEGTHGPTNDPSVEWAAVLRHPAQPRLIQQT
ncbi:hypothetical protein [Arthrobacter bambusae]|uniref:Uncharacterized protein n=1 Tax=Arthrobacter bambusae TaxID=1338426 RepID=A0AAW8DGT0_9MICC|nr:hypothetical protein [Arthrobacter bambusae]MDP9904681.1 hypothetical protein [Arthrobacter bambusae]MDQ0129497.1 hypothetical protein [Arthrobacter bambusae]MDQ0180890.1 hypothetical protein [Arthrobacter bambusae]